MEVAGLILGAVGLVKPICTTIDEILENYSGFGKDAERLRLRFVVSRTRLDSMERVLFDDNKFAPAIPGRLIDQLPEKICNDMLALLRQLYGLLMEYAAVRAQYKIEQQEATVDVDSLPSLSPEDRMKLLVLDKRKTDASQQKAIGWARKMMWVMFDKTSTEKLVSEFEVWAQRTQTLLEAVWWPLSCFQTLGRLQKLEEDEDAKSVGLLRGIGVRKLLVASPALIPSQSKAIETIAKDFCSSSQAGALELGTLKGSNGRYMVEYKQYRPGGKSSISDTAVRQRVLQLAALLHEAPISDPALRVLQCTHYFEETLKLRFGLIYRLPSAIGANSEPTTLASILDANYKGGRPSLTARIRLAHKLALCLQRLHTYLWVHKSLRPENVLLFPSEDSLSEMQKAFEDPRLVGLEYSRQESDFSDQFGESEIKRNIYRHPSRWGQPTNRFEKIHDIYGVILLEIGLWSRADQLDNGALVASNMAHNTVAVQNKLLKHAHVRLGFYAGDTYRDIVVGCLTGQFRDIKTTEAFSGLVEELEEAGRIF
ncbi:kinase-like (PK-like) [Fusarium mundagurra]|uniref:Kinase-like (PK-like) n=1 Tax=Fusarium mundagurra TaxID=1567541 RepID=A0A8H5XWC7_9HYPO|nr:kinase-like (PK-like) [Fusarium mundagurra]